jgi:hypothetical protein
VLDRPRATFEPEEWDEARQTAAEEATLTVAEYLKGVDHLAEHSEAGLEAMGISPATPRTTETRRSDGARRWQRRAIA